jgi:hypothetical protein
MQYLEHNEIWAWCAEHGVALGRENTRPAPDPRLARTWRDVYGSTGPSGREPVVAAAAVGAAGPWTECLVWVVLWGVWASSEDWPAYYAVRGARGERRALEIAPGHLYSSGDQALLVGDLAQMMTFGWEAYVLPVVGGDRPRQRLFIGHDGWVELLAPTAAA